MSCQLSNVKYVIKSVVNSSSCACYQVVLFWDIRPPVGKTTEGGKGAAGGASGAGGSGTMSSGSVITTSVGGGGGGGDKGKPETPIQSRDAADANPFKHLDLTWKPSLKVNIYVDTHIHNYHS